MSLCASSFYDAPLTLTLYSIDLGHRINQFQRSGRSGYMRKPLTLRRRATHKDILSKYTHHRLNIHITSAQQLPCTRRQVVDKEREKDPAAIDSYIKVSIYIPD